MKVTLRGHTQLTACSDCGSEHIGPRCGMTYAERLRSCRIDPSWMPARREVGNLKNYYDDEAIKDMFGQSGKDNYEQLMEETQGVGVATPEDIAKHPELVAAHYLDNPTNEVDG